MASPNIAAELAQVPAGTHVRLRLADGQEVAGVLSAAGGDEVQFEDRDDVALEQVTDVALEISSEGPE